MDCIKRRRVGQVNAHVNCAQLDNSLSYWVSELRRSEWAFTPKSRKTHLRNLSDLNAEDTKIRNYLFVDPILGFRDLRLMRKLDNDENAT